MISFFWLEFFRSPPYAVVTVVPNAVVTVVPNVVVTVVPNTPW